MNKIKINSSTILSILNGLMEDEDVNYVVEDPSAPSDWIGKTVKEILNVEYYTFRHRPYDTEIIVSKLIQEGKSPGALFSLTRAFCLMYLDSVQRVFSKTNDIITASANLEYWIQTEKVELLEDLIEDLTIGTTGIRIPVQIGKETRQALVVFSEISVSEIQETTEFGEMSVCELSVDFIFYPNAISKADYKAEFLLSNDGEEPHWVEVPFSGLSLSNTMTQKSIPRANQVRNVGSINLSKVKTMVFSFDGYVNEFIDKISDQSLASDFSLEGEELPEIDNNEAFILRLTRGESSYIYDCVIKDHLITIQEDTGNEVHSLTLTTRGIKNGAS